MSEKTYLLTESAIEAIKAKAREDAIDEVKQIIHNIYTQDLYCKADLCETSDEHYSCCDDCLFNTINENLEQIKEKNEREVDA